MSRCLILALVLSGCASTRGYGGYHCHPSYHHHHHIGAAGAVVRLLALGIGIAAAAADAQAHAEPPPPPPTPPFVGMVRLPSGAALPAVRVTLQGRSGIVRIETITDRYGDFRFPLPLPPDWYRLTLDDPGVEGSAWVWLAQERHPAGVVVVARPRDNPAEPYTD